jgi:predicted PurR-regulated permease PerM
MGLNALFIYFYGAQCPWLSIFIGRFSPLDQPNWMSKPASGQSIMITKSEIQAQQVADEKQQILGRSFLSTLNFIISFALTLIDTINMFLSTPHSPNWQRQ